MWIWPSKFFGADLLGKKSSGRYSINRGGVFLIWTQTHLCIAQERERKRVYYGRGATILVLRVLYCTWLNSILRKFCKVFSLVVSLRKIFVFSCVVVLVFLSTIIWLRLWCYDAKCFRSCITIKNLTNSRLERWTSINGVTSLS